ncbi:MAG: hypothetical protein DRN92_01980 [Thermoproteota archaeon]|nr:MAG: hypothetical protein DRN92_01980 [Candidatus Korarchaeota archaeon]
MGIRASLKFLVNLMNHLEKINNSTESSGIIGSLNEEVSLYEPESIKAAVLMSCCPLQGIELPYEES